MPAIKGLRIQYLDVDQQTAASIADLQQCLVGFAGDTKMLLQVLRVHLVLAFMGATIVSSASVRQA
jgi:hypothetical protein